MLENLHTLQRIDLLRQLHDYINHNAFNGQLSAVDIDIENLQRKSADAGGMFYPHTICRGGKLGMKISMDAEFICRLSELPDDLQKEWLIIFMLHEMVHQYCFENGIDDTGHNESFMQAADKFGLESCYDNDELLYENLFTWDLLDFQYIERTAQQ